MKRTGRIMGPFSLCHLYPNGSHTILERGLRFTLRRKGMNNGQEKTRLGRGGKESDRNEP